MRTRGFTLVEVLAALAVGATVASLALGILRGVSTGSAAIAVARQALDRDANAYRLVVELAGSMDVSEAAGSFEGLPNQVRFSTWHITAWDSWRRSRVTLERSGQTVAVSGLTEGRLDLFGGITHLECDYLLATGANAVWIREWISGVTPPIAIRLRLSRAPLAAPSGTDPSVDTLLLFVGQRH